MARMLALWLAVLLSLALTSPALADPSTDPPPPACGPEAQAGRVNLVEGEPAPTECWCYSRLAETCMLQQVERCRGDLAACEGGVAEDGARHEAEVAALDTALRACAADLEQAAAEARNAQPPWWWDRAWVGAAAVGVVAAVLAVVAR